MKSGGYSAILGGGLQLLNTPVRTGTINTQPDESAQNPPTPKTSVLVNSGNNIKFGYFGKCEFLDNEAAFAEVFGDKPTILETNIITSQYSTSTVWSFYPLGEKHNLYVFIHTCRKYYV